MEHKYNVMLIDDDEDDRMLFDMALQMADDRLTCITIDNCLEALGLLKSGEAPDILFLDLNMPSMHGFDCLGLIKQSPLPQLQHIPVVIYSTSGYTVDIEKARELGACGYLKKQSDLEQLSLKLKKFTDHVASGDSGFLCETEW